MITITTGARGRSAERAFASAVGDALDVVADRLRVDAALGRAHLELAAVVETQQLVGVAMLLVVVDQPRVRRRRDDAVERAAELELADVSVEHDRLAPARAHARELTDPLEGVERVAAQEVLGSFDRAAELAVLVAPVLATLRLAREVEVVVRRPPRRAGRAREHDSQDVAMLVLVDERAVEQELGRRPRRVPGVEVGIRARRSRRLETLEPPKRVAQLALEGEEVVVRRSSRASGGS